MDHDDDDGDCYSYSGDGGDDDGRIGVNGVLLFISKTPTAVWPDLAKFRHLGKMAKSFGPILEKLFSNCQNCEPNLVNILYF